MGIEQWNGARESSLKVESIGVAEVAAVDDGGNGWVGRRR